MRLLKSILFLICILYWGNQAKGQEPLPVTPLSNLRTKTISTQPERVLLDTLSIIPSSFKIEGVDSSAYRLDYINAVLYWKNKPQAQEVKAVYRVFSMKLNAPVQRMNFDSLVMNSAAPLPAPVSPDRTARPLINFGNINAQGSFGRQVGFGNNQSLVLNSNLNVQLNGMLADSIELQAAITDNNIPIQPDGNTQQLNQFDEVYIRFKKKDWQLNLGDIDLRESRSYFLNFYKRLQGLSFQTSNGLSKSTTSNTLVSGSIAKGKFNRNVFQGLEGNQGPYKLQGANNELFFIVLANTERVFIDGELLQRGEDQDYVIDYNTAEITFTPKRMITKDSRIQVEFEYADRNYLNTNIYAMQELSFKDRVKVRVGFYNNSDAKNAPINQVLDNGQKQFLSQIGDSIQNALYPSAILDTFAAGKILYEKVYVQNGNMLDSFYRYSTNPDSAKYNVAFTDVGFGNGDYITDNSNANGKVFQYVPPADGKKQGNYAAVVLLVTPKKQQILTLGVDYAITPGTLLKTEVAASDYDVNTYSRSGSSGQKGFAAKVNLSNTTQLRQKNKLQLVSSLDYEMVQARFQPVERLRSVEFTRDWGLPLVTERADENIIKASAGLADDKGNKLTYNFTNYNRSDHYNGFQNSLTQFTQWHNWAFNNDFTITNYTGALNKGYFLRPVIDISKKIPALDNWSVGARYTLEQNADRDVQTDTLNATAYSFDTYTFFLKSDESRQNRYGINFYTRNDRYPVNSGFEKGDKSYNLNFNAALLANKNRQLYFNTTLRKLKVLNSSISHEQEENSILSRIEYNMNEFRGFVTGNVLYEVGSGQEQKRAYAYMEVPAGTGQYAWIDLNHDSIQQLNEFELAAFPDQAKFIRINTPTNEYIKANYNTLNYSLGLNPRLLWNDKAASHLQQLIARFNLTSTLQVSRKAQATGLVELNPFRYDLNDTSLISMSSVLVNTLSFNRLSTTWGIDISNLQNIGKSLLTYGYETRKTTEWSVKYRQFFGSNFTFNLDARNGLQLLNSDNEQFDNRNYLIHKNSAAPSVSYISGTTFRVTTGYKYEVKKNKAIYGGEKAVSNELNAETKYNILQSASITARFTFNNLGYSAATDNTTTTSYIMLDGLLPGKNYLWNIMLTKRLLSNLELNFQYDGRKPGSSKTVHTGKASLTALF